MSHAVEESTPSSDASSFVALLLAAGEGRRFAAVSGRFKLVEPLACGRPMVRVVCETLLKATQEVVVVVGRHEAKVAQVLAGLPVKLVHCADAALGMGASIRCGIKAAARGKPVMVALADMPFIGSATMVAVAQALGEGASAARPVYQGQRGHPVGFSAAWRERLLALEPAEGAAPLLRAHASELRLVEVDDPGVVHDVDLPTDLDLRMNT